MTSSPPLAFTYRSARSGALTVGLSMAIVVETVVLHLWLAPRHRTLAWVLTALSAFTIGLLARSYHAWGRGAVQVTPERLALRVPGRAEAEVSRAVLARATGATWRDVPDRHDGAYINMMGPAEPNVLLVFSTPVGVRVAGGLVTRRVARLGLHLDDPGGFLRAVASAIPG